MKWALWKVDATDEQETQADRLLESLAPDLFTYQVESHAIRDRLMAALEAEQVDPAVLDVLRAEGAKVWDRYMIRLSRAAVDVAAILTVEQRRKLVAWWRDYERGE